MEELYGYLRGKVAPFKEFFGFMSLCYLLLGLTWFLMLVKDIGGTSQIHWHICYYSWHVWDDYSVLWLLYFQLDWKKTNGTYFVGCEIVMLVIVSSTPNILCKSYRLSHQRPFTLVTIVTTRDQIPVLSLNCNLVLLVVQIWCIFFSSFVNSTVHV